MLKRQRMRSRNLGTEARLKKSDEELTIVGAGMTDALVMSGIPIFMAKGTLIRMDLSNNRIRDLGARVISKALVASNLRYLNLQNNFIRDTRVLAAALEVNPSLQYLNLRQNRIRDIAPLAEALAVNTRMEALDVSDNKIGDLISLGRCLPYISLKHLNLKGLANFSEDSESLWPVLVGLARNRHLESLTLVDQREAVTTDQQRKCQDEVQYLLGNQHRKIQQLLEMDIPREFVAKLWPLILERVSDSPSKMYFYVRRNIALLE